MVVFVCVVVFVVAFVYLFVFVVVVVAFVYVVVVEVDGDTHFHVKLYHQTLILFSQQLHKSRYTQWSYIHTVLYYNSYLAFHWQPQ